MLYDVINMNKIIIAAVALIGIGGVWYFINQPSQINEDEGVMCSMDAMICPDGSNVGRTGPNCEFVCPPADDVQAHIDSKAEFIVLNSPVPLATISSPLMVTGEARGYWYFEADFPVVLTNWDGLIIAEGIATAQDEWMTEEFVPFVATLEFVSPYNAGDPDFMQNGSLILQRDNPSGLPENDNALEIPVRFAP